MLQRSADGPAAGEAEPHVVQRRMGRVALLTLNRPERLNALDLPMVSSLSAALTRACEDADAEVLVLRSAGGQCFSAGHDLVALAQPAKADRDAARALRRATCELVRLLARIRKPVVVLIEGLVLGAAAGLVAAAGYRVLAPGARIAFPETSLGTMPDAGVPYLLTRMPGGVGGLAGLAGWPLSAADALHAGLADAVLDSRQAEELVARLSNSFAGPVVAILSAARTPAAGAGDVARNRALIDDVFRRPTVRAIAEELARSEAPMARQLSDFLTKRSPLALEVLHATMARLRHCRSLDEAIALEHRVVCKLCGSLDAREGVRALLVERTGSPRWMPPSLAELDLLLVEEMFSPMLPGEAYVPAPFPPG